tara:strand:+ start:381 stop:506 length:126 start_codon:yes stop_codon:yes gene_type:complete
MFHQRFVPKELDQECADDKIKQEQNNDASTLILASGLGDFL